MSAAKAEIDSDVVEPSMMESASVEVVFGLSGSDKRVHICRRPLGAEFSKRISGPIKISKIHRSSYAQELGLQEGWVLKAIGGQDVSKMTFEATQSTLQNALLFLPVHT